MKQKLLKIAQNIAKDKNSFEFGAENSMNLLPLAKKTNQVYLHPKLITQFDRMTKYHRYKDLGQLKRFAKYLINDGETDVGSYLYHQYNALHSLYSSIEWRYGCKLLLKAGLKSAENGDIPHAIRLGGAFISYQKNLLPNSMNLFVQFLAEINKFIEKPGDKQRRTAMLKRVFRYEPDRKIAHYLASLIHHDSFPEVKRIVKQKQWRVPEALSIAIKCLDMTKKGKYDDAVVLAQGIIFSDLMADCSVSEKPSVIYILVRVMELLDDVGENENAEELFDFCNKLMSEIMKDTQIHNFYITMIQNYKAPSSIYILAQLLKFKNFDSKYMATLLSKSDETYRWGSHYYHFHLTFIYELLGQSARAVNSIYQAISIIFQSDDVDTARFIFSESLCYFLDKNMFKDAIELLIKFESDVMPKVINSSDEDEFDRLFYCFEGDDYLFHKAMSGLVETEKNPEDLINKIKDDRVRSIGLVYIAVEQVKNQLLDDAFHTIKLLKEVPVGTAIIQFINHFMDQINTKTKFNQLVKKLTSYFPNESVKWLDDV
jgi:hypothetical protein